MGSPDEDLTLQNDSYVQQILDSYPLMKAFLAGSLSGTMSTVLFQPLDLVKTKLQGARPVSSSPQLIGAWYRGGMVATVQEVLRTEHLTGLWRGLVPSVSRTVPGVGIYFASMHWLTTQFGQPTGEVSSSSSGGGGEQLSSQQQLSPPPAPLTAVCIGVTARSFSGLCLIPITVVKTRFESGEYQYRGVGQALRAIYREEGYRGLSCGLIPTLLRDAPFSGLYLMFYTQLKAALPQEVADGDFQAVAKFGCGLTSGALASLVTQPFDVIKTKMQLYPGEYPTLAAVLRHLHKKYGWTGYFKGLAPRLLRRTLMSAMAWTLYEQVTRAMGLK